MISPAATVRIGTRGSALALAQAAVVARALAARDVAHEVVVIETEGDKRQPDTAWGEGAFVTAIERALQDGRVDVAVHSAKDVPTDEDPRLHVAAFLKRAEPRDALVLPIGASGTLDTLPAGTVVGTDSPRRTGFLRAHRTDLVLRPIHGNVDTRLRRLDDGSVEALILAAAGLVRLGRAERISELVPVDIVPPAPGQGAIAVQIRLDDRETAAILSGIDDLPTRRAVETERAFLRATGGGCRSPIGALATINGKALELTAGFASVDGRATGLDTISGPVEERLELARNLASRIVALRSRLPGAPRVLVTRPADDSRQLTAGLAGHGIASVVVPTIGVELLDDTPELNAALAQITRFDHVVVTSANGARAVGRAAGRLGIDLSTIRWAAVGRATAREILAVGGRQVWTPDESTAAALARELPVEPGHAVLWARGDLADTTLADLLRERGAAVTSVTVYQTIVGPASARTPLANALAAGRIDAVVLASPSAVAGLLRLVPENAKTDLLAAGAVTVGPRTTAAALAAGFVVLGEASAPDAASIAELTADVIRRKAAQADPPQPHIEKATS